MQIKITPEDILKRGLWDYYTYYIVGNDKEAQELLKNNQEFTISEKDAIVIGLLKVMETDNLIHRFNDYIVYTLSVKSIKEKTDALIKKRYVEKAIDNFVAKFPAYWNAPKNYEVALKDVKKYIEDLQNTIINGNEEHKPLEIMSVTIQNQTYECYSSNALRKLLNFNNY
jgi:hypothetical protein